MTVPDFEFPGFRMAGTPTFNDARGTTMFAGELPEPLAVLDLAMVFGSRLWGHDAAGFGDRDPGSALGAPGLGDLCGHRSRDIANRRLCRTVEAELAEPEGSRCALVLHTGSEAVETALKTALRSSGRDRIVAFQGAYHGTFGLAMAVTHGARFREPWQGQYAGTVSWHRWGFVPPLGDDVACVVVEPWLGRAGVIPPPAGFHAALRTACDESGTQLVLDAVLCGGGRTGPRIAECLWDARPDIVCLGKAIGCGLPASAVVARRSIAEAAWDVGAGEPAHTSTMLGDPVSCAGIRRALTLLDRNGDVIEEAAVLWRHDLAAVADDAGAKLRGLGLLWAIDTRRPGGGVQLAERLLHEHRILVVPSGRDGACITIYPSAATSVGERGRFVQALRELMPW